MTPLGGCQPPMESQRVAPLGRAVAYWLRTSTTGLLSAMIFQIFWPMLMIWSRMTVGSCPPSPPGDLITVGLTVGPSFSMRRLDSSSVKAPGSFLAASYSFFEN